MGYDNGFLRYVVKLKIFDFIRIFKLYLYYKIHYFFSLIIFFHKYNNIYYLCIINKNKFSKKL